MACHGIEDSLENWSRLRDAYLRLLPQKLASRRGTVLPGVRRLLDTLRRRHVILGLLTGNLRQAARIKLSHYGLLEPFGSKPVGGFGDEHYDRDHVAQCALEALHQATGQAVETSQIWVVGDTPLDIRCARAIGARVLAVATGFFKREELEGYSPDATIEDFNALFAGYVPHWSEWLAS
jgi:phosphoglycolate phosphatase-like HAD superfamily hydrolase